MLLNLYIGPIGIVRICRFFLFFDYSFTLIPSAKYPSTPHKVYPTTSYGHHPQNFRQAPHKFRQLPPKLILCGFISIYHLFIAYAHIGGPDAILLQYYNQAILLILLFISFTLGNYIAIMVLAQSRIQGMGNTAKSL